MGLPNSQLQILAAIENELQADQNLAAAFLAFTSVTQSADMPAAEQLETPISRTGWRTSLRKGLPTFPGRLIAAIVATAAAVVIALAALLTAVPGGNRNRCGPVDPAFRAGYAATCVPHSPGGQYPLPHPRTFKGHA
jgi:hypothetical protein